MKRGELKRKTPMVRGSSTLKRGTLAPRTTPKPRKTTPPKVRATPRPKLVPDALGREHMGRVAELGCCLCRRPAEVHHVRCLAGGGQRSSDFHTIPLCATHHRLGGSGVAFHAGPRTWERIHGTELFLLARTLCLLGFMDLSSPETIARPDLGALLYPERVNR